MENNPGIMDLVELHEFFDALARRTNFVAGSSIKEIATELGVQLPRLIDGCMLFPVPRSQVELTKTWCYMVCRNVPFLGWKCLMVCVTCTDEWGGGCSLTIY